MPTKKKSPFWAKIVYFVFVISCGLLFCEAYQKNEREDVSRISNAVSTNTKASTTATPDSCLIKQRTTKILYRHHSNSTMCIYTTVEIYPEYLVWKYQEARNDCYLMDTCRYKKEDYDKLLKELSTIKFSAKRNKYHRIGGPGYSYSFEIDSVRYLFFDVSYQFSGDYNKLQDLLQQFIKSHQPRCEILFKKYSKWPHRKGWYGEFRRLPGRLQKYKVKETY